MHMEEGEGKGNSIKVGQTEYFEKIKNNFKG